MLVLVLMLVDVVLVVAGVWWHRLLVGVGVDDCLLALFCFVLFCFVLFCSVSFCFVFVLGVSSFFLSRGRYERVAICVNFYL